MVKGERVREKKVNGERVSEKIFREIGGKIQDSKRYRGRDKMVKERERERER